MALGRGLSSLIPPKKDAAQAGVPVSASKETETTKPELQPLSLQTSAVTNASASPTLLTETNDIAHSLQKTDSANKQPDSKNTIELPAGYEEEGSVFLLDIEKVKPNPYQPRKEFDEEKLQELAQSIREFGILQPLVVSKVERETHSGTDVEYQVLAGERRLRAAKLVGLERVPAIIKQIDSNREKLELAIIENVQRSDLSSIEAARAYARLQDEFGLTQREIAQRVGKSREVVANTLRLLNLPQEVQESLRTGTINESQARLLLSVSSIEKQKEMYENLVNQKLSVRKLREKISPKKDPEGIYFERKLEELLGSPVKIMRKGAGGKLVIQFYSEEEWRGLLDKLLKDEAS